MFYEVTNTIILRAVLNLTVIFYVATMRITLTSWTDYKSTKQSFIHRLRLHY